MIIIYYLCIVYMSDNKYSILYCILKIKITATIIIGKTISNYAFYI